LTRKVFNGIVYAYSSERTNDKKSEIFIKNDVYSYSGPTDVPLVVQRYSVGVVGQQHATHSHQSTKNFLGTLK